MKFSVSSREILRTLNAVSKVIVKKNALPILGNVLMRADGDRFLVVGSSSENTLSIPVSLTVQEKGSFPSFCFPYERVVTILSSIPEQPVTFHLSDSNVLTVSYAEGDFSVPVADGALFPLAAESSSPKFSFSVPSSFVLPALRQAALCVSDNPNRPVLMGVLFDVKPDGLTLVASSGRLLYKRDFNHGCPFVDGGEPQPFILPRTALPAFEAAFSKSEMLNFSFDGRSAVVSADGIEYRMRTIEGRFPNYNAIIPTDRRCHIVAPLAVFKSSVKRVSVFAGSSRFLTICNEKGALYLKTCDIESGESASELILSDDFNPEEGFRISLRADFLLNLLQNISSENVRLLFLSSDRPVIIEEDTPESSLLELLMPVQADA